MKSLCEQNGGELERIQVAALIEAVAGFDNGSPRNTTWKLDYWVVVVWKAASCLRTASHG